MSTDTGAIRTYFEKLGLEREIADIYLALHAYGPQSISQLSRNAHVERTRIYRLIDQLISSNLIEVEAQQKRGIVRAAPIANLRILISQKEQELKSLEDELAIIEQLLSRNSLSSPLARVQFYEGAEASKQIRQNILKAQSVVLSTLLKPVSEEFDQHFVQHWVKEANGHTIEFRTLLDEKHQHVQQEQPVSLSLNPSTIRYVSSRIFPIRHSSIVYDNVVAMFYWRNRDIFGIEIYNEHFANAQKVFFDMLWQQSSLSPDQ